ncbi:hypothetical protein HNY73_015379 [Argiope bruennichi]|uniref:Uncharacterized protein n=1 Tax=Argiope bruennichi TaxID=94029 RepID=A0A8T0EXB6_ARGBR|nr:hypothetical protein HNY73_015379 [Argiope bruennichi]
MEAQYKEDIASSNEEQYFKLSQTLPIIENLIDVAFSEQIYLGTDRENTDNSATKSVIEGFEDPVPEDVLESHADAFSEQNYFGERKTDNSHTESIIEDHEDPVPEDVLESHADLDGRSDCIERGKVKGNLECEDVAFKQFQQLVSLRKV